MIIDFKHEFPAVAHVLIILFPTFTTNNNIHFSYSPRYST